MALTTSLEAYWKLNEFSNGSGPVTRVDSAGSNDLTDNNTVESATGLVNDAGDFKIADSTFLSTADNASLSFADEDFTIAMWVNMGSVATLSGLCGKWKVAGNLREYGLFYRQTTNRMRFAISNDGTASTSIEADNFGGVPTSTWLFVVAWHDSVANTINIQVNDGTPDSVAHTTGCNDGGEPFRLGVLDQGGTDFHCDALIDEVGIWRRVLTAQERTDLYNNGAGLTHDFVTVTDVISIIDPGGGGDFTDLNAWEAAKQRNVAGTLEREIARCRAGNVITGSLVIDGWQTTAGGGRIRIEGDKGNGDVHSGKFTTTGVAHFSWGTGGMDIREVVEIADMVSEGSGATAHVEFFDTGASGGLVERCIFDGKSIGVRVNTNEDTPVVIRNTILQNIAIPTQATGGASTRLEIYNCTMRSTGGGGDACIQGNSSAVITENNNYLSTTGGGASNYTAAGGSTINQGAESMTDNTEATTPSHRNIAFDSSNFTDVTGNFDLSLPLGSALIDQGADLTVSEGFSDDILGGTRPTGAGWDVGAFEFGSIVNFILIDNFKLRSGRWKRSGFASSVSVRGGGSTSGYYRQKFLTSDNSAVVSSDQRETLRRVSTFYKVPHDAFFQIGCGRVDLSSSKRINREDGVRYDTSFYKDGEDVVIDGPCVVDGLIPHSFMHPREVFSTEEMVFSNIISIDNFAVKFKWVPTFGFADVESTTELARVEKNSSNYISVEITLGDRFEREYKLNEVYGPHDPILTVKKVRAGVVTDSSDLSGVYFGYTLGEEMETVEDVVQITIIHHAGGLLGVRANRNGVVGETSSLGDLNSFGLTGLSSLKYTGVGYYGPPEVLRLEVPGKGVKRKISTYRSNVLRRSFGRNIGPLLGGERDATRGQLVSSAFLDSDNFDRSDNPSLGSDWGLIRETGAGWDINTNKAVCSEAGFQYWDKLPAHKDYIVLSTILIDSDNDLVGLLLRVDLDGSADRDQVFGYSTELVQTSSSSAILRLSRFYNNSRTILASSSMLSYSSSTDYVIRAKTKGNTIAAEIFDTSDVSFETHLARVSLDDDIFQRAGYIGIIGETGGAVQEVRLDDFSVTQNFKKGITE